MASAHSPSLSARRSRLTDQREQCGGGRVCTGDGRDVELPRLDAAGGWKERPALIVSAEAFHRTRPDDLLVSLITHRIWKYHGPTDYVLQDWQAAGLTQPSVIRASLYLLLRSDVQSVQGLLTPGISTGLKRVCAGPWGFDLFHQWRPHTNNRSDNQLPALAL